MNILKKIDQGVSKITECILAFGVVGMAVILVANIISRRLLNRSLPVADEIGSYLIILTTFSGIGYAASKGRHIRMSAFFDVLPRKGQKIVIIFISLLTAVTYVYVCYIAIQYINYTIMLERVTPAMELPAWIQMVIIPVGFGLGTIQYFLNIVINFREREVFIGTEKPSIVEGSEA